MLQQQQQQSWQPSDSGVTQQKTNITQGDSGQNQFEEIQIVNSLETRPKNKNKSSFGKYQIVPAEEEVKTSCAWRLCCCCYYIFCCCCCESGGIKISRNNFVSRFEKWLKIGPSHKHSDDVLSLMTQLYAHDSTMVKKLEKKRINPDFTSPFRNDLEYFIPQLCSFYAKGDFEKPQDILNLMIMASGSSFFFSHRVWFFFQSLIINVEDEESKELYRKSRLALKGLKDACQNSKERLYLANSLDLIDLIYQFNLIEFYPQLSETKPRLGQIGQNQLGGNTVNMRETTMNNLFTKSTNRKGSNSEYKKASYQQIDLQDQEAAPDVRERVLKVKELIQNYCENNSQNLRKSSRKLESSINQSFGARHLEEDKSIEPQDNINEEEEIIITAKDIILEPFVKEDDKTFKETMINHISPDKDEETKKKHHALNAYLSTPKFMKTLTDISNDLITVTNREEYLREELKKVNRLLPASVYIPFVNNSIRNYAILHIVTDEAKVFQTKERAPLLLCLEAYRPEELLLASPQRPLNFKQSPGKKLKSLIFNKDKKVYENYRSSSWDSSNFQKDSELIDPLMSKKDYQTFMKNPYEQYTRAQKDMKKQKQALAITNHMTMVDNPYPQGEQILQLEGDADKRKTYKFSFKLTKDQQKLKAEKEKQELKDRVNKLLDKKASNPLIIHNLKRSDSLFNKIRVNDNYFNSQLKTPKQQTNQNRQNQGGLASIPEETDALQTDNDPNNEYFTNLEGLETQQNETQGQDSHKSKNITNTYQSSSDKKNFLDKSDARYSSAFQMNKNMKSFQDEDSKNQDKSDKLTSRNDIVSIEETKQEYDQEEENNDHNIVIDSSSQIEKVYDQDRRSMSMLEPNEQEALQAFLQQSQKTKQLKNNLEETNRETDANQAFFEGRPINNVFLETSQEQDERVRRNSPFGHLKTWRLIKIIVKSNDDMRQEQFAMQLITQFDQIFKIKKLNLWLKTYEILATGARCGVLEVASDALSVDSIKKKMGQQARLIDFFHRQFGAKKTKKFNKARQNFCRSLAAYSLVCYILQIKDRHNGNIMIDIEGHLMHIDFGFLLSNAPGKGIQLEKKAPFKLTHEMVEVLGGKQSKKFREFRELMRLGFMAIQEHADKIIKLVEMMFLGQRDLPCFIEGEPLIKGLKDRILPGGHPMSEIEAARHIDQIISVSYDNWRTKVYDQFQYCCQGIV
eukprot:403351884